MHSWIHRYTNSNLEVHSSCPKIISYSHINIYSILYYIYIYIYIYITFELCTVTVWFNMESSLEERVHIDSLLSSIWVFVTYLESFKLSTVYSGISKQTNLSTCWSGCTAQVWVQVQAPTDNQVIAPWGCSRQLKVSNAKPSSWGSTLASFGWSDGQGQTHCFWVKSYHSATLT